ncbi:Uncharacterised protein [Lautropia mirabilis]|jgi:hypothetical protein|uniref:Uncharacterized protein n=1 Tax=Lautropia mirabilis ATCC 51599 TaxID=887898 RepID=E7RUF3_9BURK|nr:hypothetical protein HMPREF0551_0119 [Lautropia mirabilis ATCC 51599]VEH03748.1 Uncharacterised protein [Lautropia mirabilis]
MSLLRYRQGKECEDEAINAAAETSMNGLPYKELECHTVQSRYITM